MSDATAELSPGTPPPSPAAPVAPPAPAKSKALQKRRLLVTMLLLMAAWPIISYYWDMESEEPTLLDNLLELLFTLILYLWCRYDAAEAGLKVPRLIAAAIILIPIIGYPIYKVRIKRAPMGEAISLTFAWMLLFFGIYCGSLFTFYYLWITFAEF